MGTTVVAQCNFPVPGSLSEHKIKHFTLKTYTLQPLLFDVSRGKLLAFLFENTN